MDLVGRKLGHARRRGDRRLPARRSPPSTPTLADAGDELEPVREHLGTALVGGRGDDRLVGQARPGGRSRNAAGRGHAVPADVQPARRGAVPGRGGAGGPGRSRRRRRRRRAPAGEDRGRPVLRRAPAPGGRRPGSCGAGRLRGPLRGRAPRRWPADRDEPLRRARLGRHPQPGLEPARTRSTCTG